MIVVRKTFNQDIQNALAGTELASMPGPGKLTIYCASSASDTNITIFQAGQMVVYNRPVQQRTGGVIDAMSDTPYELNVEAGQVITIDIDVNTSANGTLEVIFEDISEV
jgi:hypothetical protein